MKKVLVSVIALTSLAGCGAYYDYYKGGVRYTQDGPDCIYRNTRCEDLYAIDNFGQEPRHDRQILAPAAQVTPCDSCARVEKVSCNSCAQAQPVLKRRYIIVPAM